MKELNFKAMVEFIHEYHSEKLTEWEADFIKSMLEKETYTDKMKFCIRDIHGKYLGRVRTKTWQDC